jgi:hypothetical protein
VHVARGADGIFQHVPEYEFEEVWEKLSTTSAKASGAVLTITGAGFVASYSALAYSSDSHDTTKEIQLQYAVRRSIVTPNVCGHPR